MALPSPILRGLSRPRGAALRLAPGRSRGGSRAALGARAEVWGGVAAGGGRWGALPRGRRQKAVCFSYPPPCSMAERVLNIQRWTTTDRGGHCAALEQPEALATDIRTFFKQF